MIRRLKPGDFDALWLLGADWIDAKLKPDRDRARANYQLALSMNGAFAEGEFDSEGAMVGAVIVTAHDHAYAKKGYAMFDLWIGRIVLLDRALAWWDDRPLLRSIHIQFPLYVRPGMYRMLKSKGFDRSGDINILWR